LDTGNQNLLTPILMQHDLKSHLNLYGYKYLQVPVDFRGSRMWSPIVCEDKQQISRQRQRELSVGTDESNSMFCIKGHRHQIPETRRSTDSKVPACRHHARSSNMRYTGSPIRIHSRSTTYPPKEEESHVLSRETAIPTVCESDVSKMTTPAESMRIKS
jgi:hypothetical protein